MTIVYLLGGLVGGLVLGYLIGLSMLNKNKASWESELETVREKAAAGKREADAALKKERARANGAEEKLAAVGEEMSKLKQSAGQAQKQLEALQVQAQDLQQKHATASEAAETHKNARQQAENRYRQAEASLAAAQKQIREMGGQLEQAEKENAALKETGQRQTRELQRLRAESATTRGTSSGLDQSVEVFSDSDGTLEGVLGVLLDHEGQNAAVVADANGIIVAAAGQNDLKEGMAATTQLLNAAVKQLDGMVPFDQLRAYLLVDEGANVIAGRFFNCAGENVGLATYGPRVPNDRTLDGAMANLSSILD